MSLVFWIQRADLSVAIDDETVSSGTQVLSAFDNFNWQSEHTRFKNLENAGHENCPPGLGIVKSGGVILHLCPNSDETVLAMWNHRVPTKLLGFIKSTRVAVEEVDNLPLNIAREAIIRFIKGDERWLLSNIKEAV